MKKRELIMSTLEKMGYTPEVDSDGDVVFYYQMKPLYVMNTTEEDEQYVSVMLPQFCEIEEGKETMTLGVCNKMTFELKMIKVYVDHTFRHVTASCEFFYTDEAALEMSLRASLQMLSVVRTMFRRNMREIEEAAAESAD